MERHDQRLETGRDEAVLIATNEGDLGPLVRLLRAELRIERDASEGYRSLLGRRHVRRAAHEFHETRRAYHSGRGARSTARWTRSYAGLLAVYHGWRAARCARALALIAESLAAMDDELTRNGNRAELLIHHEGALGRVWALDGDESAEADSEADESSEAVSDLLAIRQADERKTG